MQDSWKIGIERGASFSQGYRAQFSTGEFYDIENAWSVTAGIKAKKSDVSTVATFTILTAPDGYFSLNMTAAETSAIPSGLYVYDIKLTNNATGFVVISKPSKCTVTNTVSG